MVWPNCPITMNLRNENHLYVARLRFLDSDSDSDLFQTQIFEPLFWGLIYCSSHFFLKLMLKHIKSYTLSIFVWLCCFSIFQENYLCAAKKNNFGSYPSFEPLDQANFRCFRYISSKFIKEKYSGYILRITMCFCCF